MGRTCCVPGCGSNANHSSNSPSVSTFQFPKTPERRAKWKKVMRRVDLEVTPNTVVCVNHFDPRFVMRSDVFKTQNGPVEIPRKIPKLAPGAFPTVFPTYNLKLPEVRKDPRERREEISRREAEKRRETHLATLEADKIKSFNCFKTCLSGQNIKPFISIVHDAYVSFIKVDDEKFGSVPTVKVAFKVSDDLKVKILINSEVISSEKYKMFLNSDLKCDKWSNFLNLINCLGTIENNQITASERIKYFLENIKEIVDDCESLESDSLIKIKFLLEQLHLTTKQNPRYSPETLIWAATLFYAYPGGYKTLRDSKHLTLPHPKYLQKFLGRIGNSGPGLSPSNVAFLKEKFKLLEDKDKLIILMMDEIYVNSKVSYKGGKIFGMAEKSGNSSDCTASTIQAFMYSSLRSSNKDVASLVPVRNLDAEILKKLTLEVLHVLHDIGYTVIALISDNNQINRRMFTNLCNGSLKQSIPHPFDPVNPLFIMFDSVHLYKNVRNNWLNAAGQILRVPHTSKEVCLVHEDQENCDPNNNSVVDKINVNTADNHIDVRFADIKSLYYAESRCILKLGNKLNRKSVFPSSIERQNVGLVNNVFNDNVIVALKTLKNDGTMEVSDGTITFLTWIVKWWKVVNVKNPFKGKRLNDKWCEPVFQDDDSKLRFLDEFLKFLKSWSEMKVKGKLTPQTSDAIVHTVGTVINFCHYIFQKYDWPYILLGKLQTDNLEARFGAYRWLSGCNYHVSVEQVLESERKLKLLGVLKLKAASVGEFSLTSFTEQCQISTEIEGNENLDFFKESIYDKADVPLPLNSCRVLIILASYSSTKVIQLYNRQNKSMCDDCKANLVTDIPLEIERAADVYDYLSGLDRGGLNKPADFSYDLCVNIYKLFETLVSPKYEEQFTKLRYHQRAIIKLGLKMCNVALENPHSVCNLCDTDVEQIIKLFLKTMANILMNNYTKKVNDVNTARQIAIKLSKQQKTSQKDAGKQKDLEARKVVKLSSNCIRV